MAASFSPQIAAAKGDLAALRILLDTGASVDGRGNAFDASRWTPLTYAALTGQPRAVKFLLDRGAKVDGVA